MTGTGGWPLTIIMTPDKKPFFAGTYFPKESGFGVIGLKDLILNVQDIWKDNRSEALNSGEQIFNALLDVSQTGKGKYLGEKILDITYDELSKVFDDENGGFGDFQKFPTPHNLMFLLRYWKRTANKHALYMVTKTLDSMAMGGIYDHIGFGFHRYSVDKNWLVPHFEKMLYDQALIAIIYTDAFQATGKLYYKKIAEEIFEYVLRDMSSPEGAFYSAEDADSEGVEGKFYVWTAKEIKEVLDHDEAEFISFVFNVKDDGNFNDGYSQESINNILHLKHDINELTEILELSKSEIEDKIETIRIKLYNEREKRVRPHKDDKVLTDWNGLMIAALSQAAQVFNNEKYLETSKNAADFILQKLLIDNRLKHRYREGDTGIAGNLDDYSFMVWGLLELYMASLDIKYLNAAINLNKTLIKYFWDDKNNGFYFTASDSEKILIREKKIYDSATPAGNSVELLNLIHIARLTEDPELEKMAVKMETSFSEDVERLPTGHTYFITAVDFEVGPSFEIVIVGKSGAHDTLKMLNTIKNHYIPNKVIIFKDQDNPSDVNKIAESIGFKKSVDGMATAYICTAGSCKQPTTDVNEMLKILGVKLDTR